MMLRLQSEAEDDEFDVPSLRGDVRLKHIRLPLNLGCDESCSTRRSRARASRRFWKNPRAYAFPVHVYIIHRRRRPQSQSDRPSRMMRDLIGTRRPIRATRRPPIRPQPSDPVWGEPEVPYRHSPALEREAVCQVEVAVWSSRNARVCVLEALVEARLQVPYHRPARVRTRRPPGQLTSIESITAN